MSSSEERLKTYVTLDELEMKQMEAVANYNYRMMEVAEKQIQVENDRLRRNLLRETIHVFQEARRAALVSFKRLQGQKNKLELAAHRTAFLLLGETIQPAQVGLGWRSLFFLLPYCPSSIISEIGLLQCSKEHLVATNFFSPRKEVPDVPQDIEMVLELFGWARRMDVIPKLSSPMYLYLQQIIDLIAKGAELSLEPIRLKKDAAESEYKRVRETPWQLLTIDPKQVV